MLGDGGRGFEAVCCPNVEISMDMESGRAEVWRGIGGERREMIFENSLLYHSESDSGSESEASSES